MTTHDQAGEFIEIARANEHLHCAECGAPRALEGEGYCLGCAGTRTCLCSDHANFPKNSFIASDGTAIDLRSEALPVHFNMTKAPAAEIEGYWFGGVYLCRACAAAREEIRQQGEGKPVTRLEAILDVLNCSNELCADHEA